MTVLSKILIYPIKSLDGLEVQTSTLTAGGALLHDREYAIFDSNGHYVNGKRNPRVHQLRTRFDPEMTSVQIKVDSESQAPTFHLQQQQPQLEAWLSEYFGEPVHLRHDPVAGFPDDRQASGPTIISTATVTAVAGWFPGLDAPNIRRRLRTNLELETTTPFWEDQLFTTAGQLRHFLIGEVQFGGTNPCQRCPVPTRDPQTGAVYPEFQKIFTYQRQQTLPEWVNSDRFNHFYRLAVNTLIAASEAGKILRVGDEVTI